MISRKLQLLIHRDCVVITVADADHTALQYVILSTINLLCVNSKMMQYLHDEKL